MSTLIAKSRPDSASVQVESVQDKSGKFNWVFFTAIVIASSRIAASPRASGEGNSA